MRFRFRKSFKLLPGLKGTVSKKGVSLNFKAGIFSKSWGTRGNSTTIDMPGTSGMFWREERRRRKRTPEELAQARRTGWARAVYALLMLNLLIGLARIHLAFGCETSGHPTIAHVLYCAVTFAVYSFASRQWAPLRGPLGVLLALAAFYVHFKVFGSVVSPSIHCS